MAKTVDIKVLLEAGAHFGHKTSRWHPKMAPYIYGKRGGTHIIDLTTTVEKLEEALAFVEKQTAAGRQVLFVGTKRQAKQAVKEAAEACKQPYVNERWLGGMLTNSNTINGRIKHLKDLEKKMESGELAIRYNKLEVQRFQEQIDQMNYNYGGIKELNGKPGVVFVTDILEDDNAVSEAVKLGIPVVAIVDTNADPSKIAYPIPANDDAIQSVKVITDLIAGAVLAGRGKMAEPVVKTAKPVVKAEAKPTAKEDKAEAKPIAKKASAEAKESPKKAVKKEEGVK